MFYAIQICSFFTTEQKRCVQSWFWIHQKSMTKTKNRSRIMTWFNPAFNKVVSANVATSFLWLIGRYFPKSHRLHKIFSRDTGKVNYGCIQNMSKIYKVHISKITSTPCNQLTLCNCWVKVECLVEGECQTMDAFYDCHVTSSDLQKIYFGLAEAKF